MAKKWVWLAVGLMLGLSLFLVGSSLLFKPYAFRGSLIDPAQPAPDFALKDQNGRTFSLDGQKGKVVLLFFGYTSCTDVCPTTLSDFSQMNAALGKDSERIQFVFVTVDPERDTQQQISNYLAAFNAPIEGLTGSQAELQPVWKSYGVYVQKGEGTAATGYTVDHSSRIYAIDPSGKLRLTYTYGTPVQDVVSDIQHLLKEG